MTTTVAAGWWRHRRVRGVGGGGDAWRCQSQKRQNVEKGLAATVLSEWNHAGNVINQKTLHGKPCRSIRCCFGDKLSPKPLSQPVNRPIVPVGIWEWNEEVFGKLVNVLSPNEWVPRSFALPNVSEPAWKCTQLFTVI